VHKRRLFRILLQLTSKGLPDSFPGSEFFFGSRRDRQQATTPADFPTSLVNKNRKPIPTDPPMKASRNTRVMSSDLYRHAQAPCKQET